MAAAVGENAQASLEAENAALLPSWIESIDTQIFMIYIGIIASVFAIATLQGVQEKQNGFFPNRDYSYLEILPRIEVVLVLIVAAYFAYLAYLEYQRSENNSILLWLLIAALLALAAEAIRTYLAYFGDIQSTAGIEEVVE